MKLLIIFPNATNTPFIAVAVPILAGIAKNKNWDVDYFDTYIYKKDDDKETDAKTHTGGFKHTNLITITHKNYNCLIPDLQKKIDKINPDLIAITCLAPEYNFLLKFLDKIKIPTHTKIIIGGIHVTLSGETSAKTNLFDLVVTGEGEEIFIDILTKIENKKNLKLIEGTYFIDKTNGEIVKNPQRLLLPAEKLWSIKRDFSIFGSEFFIRPFDGKNIRRTEVEISRGCPFHCAYCGNSALKIFNKGLGKYVKTRPIQSSMEDMKILLEKYKIDIFSLADECFLAHPISWLKEFMDAYKKEINKPYIITTRPETVTEERIKFLLSYEIPFQPSIGVESGSDRILLDVCDRSCTVDKIIPAFEILNKYKIRTNTYFIVGFPFETREDVFKSIDICRKIKPSVSSVAIFQPYPGQKLTRVCIENGFMSKNDVADTLTSSSLLTMPKPYLSKQEITNLWRVFMLYASLPVEYHEDVEKCEKDYDNNYDLFNSLVKMKWEKYDWAKQKEDIKLI